MRRKERRRTETPTVALAGYTNVGKSTLLNALTDAGVSVRDRLFETLDPTTRGFEHEGRRYLVTDTVGFVRRLPHQLVEGFAATLEETLVADLILHVVDGSASEERLSSRSPPWTAVLREIGANDLPVELVVNKIDAVDALGTAQAREPLPGRAPGLRRSPARGSTSCGRGSPSASPSGSSACASSCRTRRAASSTSSTRSARRSSEREDTPEGVLVVARLPRREMHRFAPYLIAEEHARRRRTGA